MFTLLDGEVPTRAEPLLAFLFAVRTACYSTRPCRSGSSDWTAAPRLQCVCAGSCYLLGPPALVLGRLTLSDSTPSPLVESDVGVTLLSRLTWQVGGCCISPGAWCLLNKNITLSILCTPAYTPG